MVGGLKGTGVVVDPDGKLGGLIPGIELVKRLRASLSLTHSNMFVAASGPFHYAT